MTLSVSRHLSLVAQVIELCTRINRETRPSLESCVRSLNSLRIFCVLNTPSVTTIIEFWISDNLGYLIFGTL